MCKKCVGYEEPSKSEWLNDAQGDSSVQKEAEGLRSKQAWDPCGSSAKSPGETGQKIKVTDATSKHFELGPQRHKYKGRIIYRGDYVPDASGNQVFVDGTATTPARFRCVRC